MSVTQHRISLRKGSMLTMCLAIARKSASHCCVRRLSSSNMYEYCIGVVAPGVFVPEAGLE